MHAPVIFGLGLTGGTQGVKDGWGSAASTLHVAFQRPVDLIKIERFWVKLPRDLVAEFMVPRVRRVADRLEELLVTRDAAAVPGRAGAIALH